MNEDIIKQYARENPKRDVAVLGPRDFDGNVLLMRSHKLPEFWQPIGGGIDKFDASPKAAALRELREEFGINLSHDVLYEVLTTQYDFGEGTVYFFEAIVDRADLEFYIDPVEVIDHGWFSNEDALKLPVMAATKKYIQQL